MTVATTDDLPRRSLWIFNHYAVPSDAGFGTRHFDIARELHGMGYDVTIFASSVGHLSGRNERLNRLELAHVKMVDHVRFVWMRNIPYHGNSAARTVNMLSYLPVALIAQMRRSRPDYIIGSSPHPFAAFAAWLVARTYGLPFFYEVRDLWPQTLLDIGEMTSASPRARLLYFLEGLLYGQATRVISLLDGMPDYARGRGLDSSKIVHIPNGVNLAAWRGHGGVHPRPLARFRQEHPFIAAYAGAFGLANNVPVILCAAKALLERGRTDIGVALVGDGPDRGRLHRMRKELGLTNVLLLDPIPKTAIPDFLRAADAAIVHFRRSNVHRHGVSFNKLYDYMASRSPVIFACATPYDPVKAVAAGISCEPDSPDALADALVRLADMPAAEREEMGRRGGKYVRDHHDVRSLARRLDALLVGRVPDARQTPAMKRAS